ncbi:DUF2279 domain-containing protein [Zobellella aerophila]|uniref:DUF2279 domain-containing protein n=1 Tax=Zobellella aerophila TaxID=870480 RepID=A0ABP6V377_9GAMM
MTLLTDKRRLGALPLVPVLFSWACTNNAQAACEQVLPGAQQQQKLQTVLLAGTGLITLWGVANWDYFSRVPHAQSEGWFGQHTNEGGADKLGHLYSVYAASQGLGYLYEQWCFTPGDAALYGALSAFAVFGYMEVGDSFSDFGFSYEDVIANGVGSTASYYLSIYPELAEKIDIRWEYGVKPQQADFITDYQNSKFLVALKLSGFDAFKQGVLKYGELHLGYLARGYSDPTQINERSLYLGVGLSLSELFRQTGHHKTATLFNYYQAPGTYITTEKQLSD